MADLNTLLAQFEQVKENKLDSLEFFTNTITSGRGLLIGERDTIANAILVWAEKQKETNPGNYYYAIYLRGFFYFHSEEYERGLSYSMQARKLFTEIDEKEGIAHTSVTIGAIYRTLGDIELSIQYLREAISWYESEKKTGFVYTAGCFNLAEVYALGGKADEALSLYQKVLDHKDIPGIAVLQALTLTGMGNVYLDIQKIDQGMACIQQALEMSEKAGNKPNLARIHTVLAHYYFETGDYAKALEDQNIALKIRENLNIDGGTITNLTDIAEIYLKTGKETEAVEMLNKALQLAEKTGVKTKQYHVHQLLSNLFEHSGEKDKAHSVC